MEDIITFHAIQGGSVPHSASSERWGILCTAAISTTATTTTAAAAAAANNGTVFVVPRWDAAAVVFQYKYEYEYEYNDGRKRKKHFVGRGRMGLCRSCTDFDDH